MENGATKQDLACSKQIQWYINSTWTSGQPHLKWLEVKVSCIIRKKVNWISDYNMYQTNVIFVVAGIVHHAGNTSLKKPKKCTTLTRKMRRWGRKTTEIWKDK